MIISKGNHDDSTEESAHRKLLAQMLEKVRFGPFHFLFTLQHPGEEEVVMFVKDFGGIISVLANPMCVVDILKAPCK